MKKVIALFIALMALASCMDLDAIITPIIFINEGLDEYQMDNFTKAELYDEIKAAAVSPPGSFALDEITDIDSNGYKLHAFHLYLDANGSSGKTILFYHGNYRHLDHYYQRMKVLLCTGWNVFSVDYRGFGMSEGEPTEQGLLEDGLAAWDYLVNTLSVDPSDILIYGYSLGSVPAVYVAANGSGAENIAGLVLEAPIGSFALYVQDAAYLNMPGSYISRYKLDNISAIKGVDPKVRFLWLHGTADDTNRYDTHGQAIFNGFFGTNKSKKLVNGAIHSNVPYVLSKDFSVYINGIANFANNSSPYFPE